jgi:hypothetical protein
VKIEKYYFYSLLAILGTILVLISFGQPVISQTGNVYLYWFGGGVENSQQISDWYSFSHFLHGIIFFFLISFIFRKFNFNPDLTKIFFISVLIESCWEILENTPVVINRYREGALAAGYFGDSVLNSTFDILFMSVGFFFAKKFGWKISLATLIFIELFTLYFIRDNLTLNIIMLIHPFSAISAWQVAI